MFTVVVMRVLLRILVQMGLGLCRIGGNVHCFLGAHWVRVNDEDLVPLFGLAAENTGVPQLTAQYHAFRNGLLRQFEATASVSKPEPSKTNILINFEKGPMRYLGNQTTSRVPKRGLHDILPSFQI